MRNLINHLLFWNKHNQETEQKVAKTKEHFSKVVKATTKAQRELSYIQTKLLTQMLDEGLAVQVMDKSQIR